MMSLSDPFQSIVDMMREEGAYNNPPSIELGVMVSDTVLQVGGLQVDDFYAADNIVGGLVKDDTVAVMATADGETYIILARVVRA